METQVELEKLAEQAREQRLDGPARDTTQFPLIGYCFENALVLFNVLKTNGYSPSVIAGTTNRVADELVQNNVSLDSDISSVKDLGGLLHYWVKVDGYIVDIASDTEEHLGEIFISKNKAKAYHSYKDSEAYAEQIIHNPKNSRCVFCGSPKTQCSH